jgi:hypothetical protein
MLARNLIAYEIFSLIAPEDIQFDLFDLMLMRNNGIFTAYFSPCGLNQITEKYIRNYHCAHTKTHKKQYHSSEILPVMTKLTRAVGGAWCNYLREKDEDVQKTFSEIWRQVMPSEHVNDTKRCE